MSEQLLHPEPQVPTPLESPAEADSGSAEHPDDTPSLEVAKRFLEALAPTGLVSFQSLPEGKRHCQTGRLPLNPNTTRHGSFNKEANLLLKLNKAGSGIFVMVNKGDGKGRRAENVQSVRAVFVDLDGASLQPVLEAKIPPSITVESSPGRYHAYWLVRDMPMRDFKAAQQQMAAMFQGDKAVNDLPRLMRVPGFLHLKSGTPFRSRLLKCEPELVWEWKDLANGLGLPKSMHLPAEIPEGERNITLFKLAGAAAMTGTPKSECLIDLVRINEKRCSPALPTQDVVAILDRAYRNPPMGAMKIPLSLLNDNRFLELGSGPKLLLLLAYQRICNKSKDSEIPLLWKDFKQHFPRQNTFKSYRRALADEELLLQTKHARKLIDGKTDYNLYKLAVTGGI